MDADAQARVVVRRAAVVEVAGVRGQRRRGQAQDRKKLVHRELGGACGALEQVRPGAGRAAAFVHPAIAEAPKLLHSAPHERHPSTGAPTASQRIRGGVFACAQVGLAMNVPKNTT